MEKLLGTNSVIEETRHSSLPRKTFMIFLMFFAVFIIGSMLSSLLAAIPQTIYFMNNDEFAGLINSQHISPENFEEQINSILENIPEWLKASTLFATAGTILTCMFFCKKMDRKRLFTMGIVKKGCVPEYLFGLLLGFAAFGSIYLLSYLLGGIKSITINDNLSVWTVILFFFGFLVQGFSEEILLRGYLFPNLATNGSVTFALFGSAFVFTLLHINNFIMSDAPLYIILFAVLNIFLYGVLSGLYFLRRGSIWGIAAFHSAWNFMQGNIFGLSVSGQPLTHSVFTSALSDRVLFNGSSFGPEGSMIASLIFIIGIAVLLMLKNKPVNPPLYGTQKGFSGNNFM